MRFTGLQFFWRGERYGKGIEAVKVAIKMSGNVRVTFPSPEKKLETEKVFSRIYRGDDSTKFVGK